MVIRRHCFLGPKINDLLGHVNRDILPLIFADRAVENPALSPLTTIHCALVNGTPDVTSRAINFGTLNLTSRARNFGHLNTFAYMQLTATEFHGLSGSVADVLSYLPPVLHVKLL